MRLMIHTPIHVYRVDMTKYTKKCNVFFFTLLTSLLLGYYTIINIILRNMEKKPKITDVRHFYKKN